LGNPLPGAHDDLAAAATMPLEMDRRYRYQIDG